MRPWNGLTDSPSWWATLGHATGTLMFDVGANIGQCAELFAPRFVRVVSFEPCAEAYALLYAHHPANVDTVACALSDHVGTVELAENTKSIETGQLTSGVAAEEGMGWGDVTGWRTVTCSTIDHECGFWGYPDAVKIDTEGHEMAILAGATVLIGRHDTAWYIEMHARQFETVVRELFDGYQVDTVNHDYAPPPWDNYYMRCLP